MKCNHCNRKLNIGAEDSSPPLFCPFCGKSLVKKEDWKFYENSKDALAAIMSEHGADVLLDEKKLKAYFDDYAPSVPQKIKRLVYAVYESGATKVLKSNLNASQADKESAVKVAIRNLTEDFSVQENIAQSIVYEFVDALGWQVKKSVVQQAAPPIQTPPAPADKKLKSSVISSGSGSLGYGIELIKPVTSIDMSRI